MAASNNNFGSKLLNGLKVISGLVDLFKSSKDTVPENLAQTGTQTEPKAMNRAATQPEIQIGKKSYYDSLLNSFNDYSKSMYDTYAKQSELATAQAYALKRKQQQDAERDFYNQLYDTNATVLDTIRRNNAAAIASGASKGAQAANELSAILQGQQASVDAASQLAQSNYDLASEEAEAYIGAEQAARQQADTAVGNLAGNLAVAAQADAALESSKTQANATIASANIDADNAIKTSEVAQLQDAVKKYLDPNSDETTKMTNKLIIESLTGQTLEDLGFKITTPTKPADSNKKDVETTVPTYDSIINKAAHPETARRYIEQAIKSYNETGGSRVVDVKGKSNTDLAAGYIATINYGDKDYNIHLIGGQIKYSNIKNDVLKTVVDNGSDGDPIKIDGDYYVIDKTGNDKPILQKIAIYKTDNFYKDFVKEGGINTSYVPNFTNKKNN